MPLNKARAMPKINRCLFNKRALMFQHRHINTLQDKDIVRIYNIYDKEQKNRKSGKLFFMHKHTPMHIHFNGNLSPKGLQEKN